MDLLQELKWQLCLFIFDLGRNYIILYTIDFITKTSTRPLDILKYLGTGHCDEISYRELFRKKKENVWNKEKMLLGQTVLIEFILYSICGR